MEQAAEPPFAEVFLITDVAPGLSATRAYMTRWLKDRSDRRQASSPRAVTRAHAATVRARAAAAVAGQTDAPHANSCQATHSPPGASLAPPAVALRGALG